MQRFYTILFIYLLDVVSQIHTNWKKIFIFLFSPRGKTSSEDARHWSDESTLRNRAFFRPERPGGRLVLDGVRAGDEGEYRWNDNYINLKLQEIYFCVKLKQVPRRLWKGPHQDRADRTGNCRWVGLNYFMPGFFTIAFIVLYTWRANCRMIHVVVCLFESTCVHEKLSFFWRQTKPSECPPPCLTFPLMPNLTWHQRKSEAGRRTLRGLCLAPEKG